MVRYNSDFKIGLADAHDISLRSFSNHSVQPFQLEFCGYTIFTFHFHEEHVLFRQYGTFELRIRSEFYCSNDLIVGHISLPHYRETVKVTVYFMSSLDSFKSRCERNSLYERYCKIHAWKHIWWFFFWNDHDRKKTFEDMSMFVGK